ncbi:predicted protein [Postia placenta Mad-698-R]|uniref:C2H2-type domain-containing protein n=1 Tax=Postia placenta MAD-698-R-SB12 TaxID=670580 RepID=A0A1X6N0M3_9APHY|nr:hypothetical protein POSPLADRAFT_1143467 [Postia placenta MAD-698-R-SB12]EED77625.1 predicted protein [Postia placenta Mad-698-R]OSX62179.1 hypothetical protein POSPLADRAFT_1143467 [Postia placenta MAD-698-R-SB12]
MHYQQRTQPFAHLDDSQLYGSPPAFPYPSPPTPPSLILSQLSYSRPAYEQSHQEWDQFVCPEVNYTSIQNSPHCSSSLREHDWPYSRPTSGMPYPMYMPTASFPTVTSPSEVHGCEFIREGNQADEDIWAYLEGMPSSTLGLAQTPSPVMRGTVSPAPLWSSPTSGPSTQRYTMWNERVVVSSRRAMAACTSPSGSGTHRVPSLVSSGLPAGARTKTNTEYEESVPNAGITGIAGGFFNNNHHSRYIEAVDVHTTGNDNHVATAVRPATKKPRSSSSSALARTKTRSKTMSKRSERLPMQAANDVEQATQQVLRKQKRKAPDDAGADRPCAAKKAKCSNTGRKKYPCLLKCGHKAIRRYDIERHMALSCPLRPSTSRKPFPCSICGGGFSRNDALIRHMRDRSEKCFDAERLDADSGGYNDH